MIASASHAQSSRLLFKFGSILKKGERQIKCCCPFQFQALREEIGQLEEKQQQDLNCQKSEHRQEMENCAAEQLTLREELRKELAQVHIEKFSAMAAELSHLHKVRNTGVFLNCLEFLIRNLNCFPSLHLVLSLS